ncbi:hypothetical protein GOP47_0002825 [Adiantum capillus-veneris]|uniref:Uncharacterized protein n=1 Tax=Adiantum capillus-veneris TaxID=13818 RepID=A0A9D4VCT0_ADICA|nr:hypothetical protein GOP47_0002825 [Adiantum capillus-veneris]
MAAQDAPQPPISVAVVVAPPYANHPLSHHECSDSASPPANSTSFVKAIDKKARSYLKTLERSLTFSAASSKEEDPSITTIEFLRARLHAQRAEYKAEKQRAQHLAKKVLELEQRLKLEVERGKSLTLPISMDTDHRRDASSCNHCAAQYRPESWSIINKKDPEVVHLRPTNTISKQASTSKLKRLTCSQSFPDMNAVPNLDLEHGASARGHASDFLRIQPPYIHNVRAMFDEDSDFITEQSDPH